MAIECGLAIFQALQEHFVSIHLFIYLFHKIFGTPELWQVPWWYVMGVELLLLPSLTVFIIVQWVGASYVW